MKTKAMYGCAAAILLGLAPFGVGAFTLEPMTVILTPTGSDSVATFRIKNGTSGRAAVRFRVVTRSIGPDEEELNTPADEFFVVRPSRLFLERGGAASATVQWKGPAMVDLERSFRLIAEEIPQDAVSGGGPDGDRSVASLYVGSPLFASELLASVTGDFGPDGKKGYSVEIRNVGRRHVIAAGARVVLTDGGGRPFSSKELKHLSGANYLPGMNRRIFIPRTDATAGRTYGAKVEYAKTY